MARNIAATNAGVGQASVTTKVKLTIQAAKKCLAFGAFPLFVLPHLTWLYAVTPHGFDVTKIHISTFFADPEKHRKWRIRDASGNRQIITLTNKDGELVQYFTPAQIQKVLQPSWDSAVIYDRVWLLSFVLGGCGYLLLWTLFTRRGLLQQTNKRIRGASEVIDAKELDRLVRERDEPDYTLVDVALPKKSAMMGILAIGAQGSGKSLTIHDFMRQVFAKKRKSIIYDQSGEFYRAYFRPGIDKFFNPACLGSVAWSIFKELTYTYDANTLSHAFLPPKGTPGQAGANGFFEDAARTLFGVILLRLAKLGAQNTKDIATAFLSMPEEEMSLLIQNSVASSAIAGDSKGQRQGVISSISIYLDGIAAVNEGDWTISDFMAGDDDARLFITGTEDTKAMFAPLYRLILQVAFSSIAARQEIVHEDRYWFFLDEVHTLGDIKVDEQLATLRKFGVCVFAGTQNDTQFVTSLGKERAETAMNGFNTLLQLRMNEPNAQDRAAKRLGKAEMETISQNQAVAVVEQRDGAGLVISEQEKWIVMPSDIGQLEPCQGYLKLAGSLPAAKLDYSSWLTKPRWWGRRRVDAFSEVQDSPPRDPRFLLFRKSQPVGETPFDDVRRQAEVVRQELAEKKKQEEEQTKGVVEERNMGDKAAGVVVNLEMTTASPSDTTTGQVASNDVQLGF